MYVAKDFLFHVNINRSGIRNCLENHLEIVVKDEHTHKQFIIIVMKKHKIISRRMYNH